MQRYAEVKKTEGIEYEHYLITLFKAQRNVTRKSQER